jgi:magnesium-transporting ATPase (P-type)
MFNDLCVGKTGTLTKAELEVKQIQLGNAYESILDESHWKNDGMIDIIKSTIIQSIVALSDVRLVPNEDAKYEAKGTPLEKGMIKFLMDKEITAEEQARDGNLYNYDCPNMLKYVNDIRPNVQTLPFY